MLTLALAGGTSATLGRAITTAVLSGLYTKMQWKTVILTRNPKKPNWLQAVDPHSLMTDLRGVDYFDTDSLSSVLEDVDTVISVTSATDGTQPRIQLNLLDAANRAGCRRFVPSHWGMGPKAYESGTFGLLEGGVWQECLKRRAHLESARFNNGLFLNYLGYGILSAEMKAKAAQPTLEELQAGGGYAQGADYALEGVAFEEDMPDGEGTFFISLKNAIAEIPVKEDGSWPRISMTSVRDIGRFVAASLDLPKWEQNMNIMGDTLTAGELIELSERVTGRRFDVQLLKRRDLQEQLDALPDGSLQRLALEFKESYCRDEEGFGWSMPTVNELCPRVKPMSTEEYLQRWWTQRA
ncbi:NAD(P)-binding protein [Zopfia rhizophila CBS 207.26]|uniref:NAD(P)-binding protein n=1 Tax=Zopfia rhizophila CBS 207.26 TaxID=1314779 RepID=A0A6A6EE91_9PEZI|nr:NAD(P)-binding protein [Zopfia rhizophila CBS 207.26]